MLEAKIDPDSEDQPSWYVNVWQSVDSASMVQEQAPCLRSKLKVVRLPHVRVLSAKDYAKLQGLGPVELHRFSLSNLRSGLLADLRGSSFSANSAFLAVCDALTAAVA